ncbi:MAG: type IV pilus modification protein PilV [Saezia sp.]
MKTQLIKKYQLGFSLIEVLVSMVLLALCFVTMLVLQVRAVQFSTMAYYQAIATQVASGLAASVRANPEGASNYKSIDLASTPAVAETCPNGITCTASQIAASDVIWARRAARALLPQGDVVVNVNVSDGDLDIVLVWDDNNAQGQIAMPCPVISGVNFSGNGRSNAQCLDLRVKI